MGLRGGGHVAALRGILHQQPAIIPLGPIGQPGGVALSQCQATSYSDANPNPRERLACLSSHQHENLMIKPQILGHHLKKILT